MISRVEVHSGRYHDSVRLMQASKALREVSGVDDALVAMATDLNLELLSDMGFDMSATAGAGPNDLILAVRAQEESAFETAHRVLDEALRPPLPDTSGGLDAPAPRTVGSAVGATVALISVPGEHAFVEAMEALERGLHVMIFSDNVALDHEVVLKRYGREHGLAVMGPDCGTAVIGGVGLGFANAVGPGPVGIVGASGTGIQQLCCLIDDAGVGISQALGTGSHDLSERVGASATLQGIEALDADPATEVIAVVSKPPDPAVADRVRSSAEACTKPVVIVFMGDTTLEQGAGSILGHLGLDPPDYTSWTAADTDHRPGSVRGLFSGGTLRDDARFVASDALGEIGLEEEGPGHVFVDYGDDRYTRGRAHPMIDQTVRIERLREAGADPSVGVVLMDVVLGYGSNPDPASELVPAIEEVVRLGAAVVVSLCGSTGDPQGRDAQARALHEAGASVWLSNAAAARHAAALWAATSGRAGA